MERKALNVIEIKQLTDKIIVPTNLPLTYLNDHVVRVSVMTEPYFWHYHPDSDETFLVLEGTMWIDLEDRSINLQPSQLFTIPKDVVHRTRPGGKKSINLTFEHASLSTVEVDQPQGYAFK